MSAHPPTLPVRILCEMLIRQTETTATKRGRPLSPNDAAEFRQWLAIALDDLDLLIPKGRWMKIDPPAALMTGQEN